MASGLTGDSSIALLKSRVSESGELKLAIAEDEKLLTAAARAARIMTDRLRAGNKLLFFGNGGSSMDAGHLAAELVGRFYVNRRSLPAVALSDATAAMTAIGNDYSYDEVFSRQIEGMGMPGDVAIGLTTSGNSRNVVNGLSAARERGLDVIAITGAAGGAASDIADVWLGMPTDDTPRVQECYMVVGHTICELIESAFVD